MCLEFDIRWAFFIYILLSILFSIELARERASGIHFVNSPLIQFFEFRFDCVRFTCCTVYCRLYAIIIIIILHGRSSLFLACHTSSWCIEPFIFIPKPMQPNICVNCTSTVAFSSFALSIQWIVYGFSYSYSHLFSYTICDPLHHCASFILHIVQKCVRSSRVTMLIHDMNIVCNSISNVQCSAHSNVQNNASKIYNKLMKLMPEWNVYGCETPNSDAHC